MPGNPAQDRYGKMSEGCEAEQVRSNRKIKVAGEWIEQQEEMNAWPDALTAPPQKYTDAEELTPTIVNAYIKKSAVHAPVKSGGRRARKGQIDSDFMDDGDMPVLSEPVIAKMSHERRKTV